MISNSNKSMSNTKVIILLGMMFLGPYTDVVAMKRARDNRFDLELSDTKKQKKGILQELAEDEFIVYSSLEPHEEGTKVSLETLMLSKTMFNIKEDFGGCFPEKEIPLPFSQNAIKSAFDLLSEHNKSIDRLMKEMNVDILKVMELSVFVEVMNLITYLDVPSDTLQLCIKAAAERINEMSLDGISDKKCLESLETINPDIQYAINSIILKQSNKFLGSLLLDKKPTIERGRKNATFNYAGDKVIYITEDNKLVVEDIQSKEPEKIHVLKSLSYQDDILSIIPSKEKNRVLIKYKDSRFDIFDLTIGKEIFSAPMGLIRYDNLHCKALVISPSGDLVAILSKGSIYLWDIKNTENKEPIILNNKGKTNISCMDFSPCGKYIITGGCKSYQYKATNEAPSDGSKIIRWDVRDINNILEESINGYEDYLQINQIKWTDDGKIIVVFNKGRQNGLMLLEEVKDERPTKFIPHILYENNNFEGIGFIRFSENGKRIVTHSFEGEKSNLLLWDFNDISNIQHTKFCPKKNRFIDRISMSLNGKRLFFNYAHNEYSLNILDISSFQSIKKYSRKESSFFDNLSVNAEGSSFTVLNRSKHTSSYPHIKQTSFLSEQDCKMLDGLNTYNFRDTKLISYLCNQRKIREKDHQADLKTFEKCPWRSNNIPPTIKTVELSDKNEKTAFASLPANIQGLLKDNWQIEEK
jgi:WD40 repeat protein